MTLDEKLVDKRVVRRNLERGRIDAAAYRQLLDGLPDASGNVERFAERAPSGAVEPMTRAPRAETPGTDASSASPA